MSDFIEGVDHLPERHVVDFSLNAYSDIFIDFLINVNCCIVNGRNSVADDFTFVSTRGCSVVDYCLTPYESLSRISNFEVIRTSQLVQNANILDQVDMSYAIPDHSFLTWSLRLDCFQQPESGKRQGFERIRYKVDSIPESFMSTECIKNEIYSTIANLESSTKGQIKIDGAYDRFCETVKQSMNKDLEKKIIKIEVGVSNKKRKLSKLWWNDVLSGLWNEMVALARAWLRENHLGTKKTEENRHLKISAVNLF